MRRALGLVWSRRRAALRDDEGQIMLLSIGYAVLALALILVIASASAVHVERKQLLALADAAAVDAADALDLELFYSDVQVDVPDPGSAAVPLTDATVREAARDHIARSPAAAALDGVAVTEPTGALGGTTAQVTLVGRARLPLVPWVLTAWSDGVPLAVTSTARAQ